MKSWLFEYDFDGEVWALEVEAEDSVSAVSRVIAMGNAVMIGELIEKVPERTYTPPKLVASSAD